MSAPVDYAQLAKGVEAHALENYSEGGWINVMAASPENACDHVRAYYAPHGVKNAEYRATLLGDKEDKA